MAYLIYLKFSFCLHLKNHDKMFHLKCSGKICSREKSLKFEQFLPYSQEVTSEMNISFNFIHLYLYLEIIMLSELR